MRSEKDMMDLILRVAKEDERIRAVLLTGSRANPQAQRDGYQDYDIVYYVEDVAPFFKNVGWVEAHFGRPAVMQMPESMTHPLLPPDGDGHFTYLMLFDDGNRIDLSFYDTPFENTGEPAVVLLDKDGRLSHVHPQPGFWNIRPPAEEAIFRDCCNEFWWCLNNVAKGIARRELPYAMDMFNRYVRDMLNQMVEWAIGIDTGFTVSAGKNGKYFQRFLPEAVYARYRQTYSDGNYTHLWGAVETACSLFRDLAQKVAKHFGYTYFQREDDNMTAYLKRVRTMAGD